MIDLKFLTDTNFKSGETNCILAPKEQPPRKLSGKRTDQSITLWKEIHFRRGAKLSGKNTDGVTEVICQINI